MDFKVSRPCSQSLKYCVSEKKGREESKDNHPLEGTSFQVCTCPRALQSLAFLSCRHTGAFSTQVQAPCSKIEDRPRGTELGLLGERMRCFEFLLSWGYIGTCPNGQWYPWYLTWKIQQLSHPASNPSLCSTGVCLWWQYEMTVSFQTLHLESILCF